MIKKFEAHGEYYREQSTYDWRKDFMNIMNRVNYIKSKMKEYKIGITFDRDVIYINFLRDK